MEIDELVSATATLNNVPGDTVATLLEKAMHEARVRGLRVLPARIDGETVVTLDSDALSVTEVVDAAVAGGAALFYIHHELADTAPVMGALAEAGLPEVCPQRDRFQAALKRVEGWVARLELGFAHHGALHVWTVQAAWQDTLEELIDPPRRLGMQVGYPDRRQLCDDEITALAERVVADPAFRRAATFGERVLAGRKVPQVAELHDDPATRFNAREDELTQLLSTDPKFRTINTAPARKQYAREWILAHSDGLRADSTWVGELAAQAWRRGTGGAAQLSF
ncbi:hypothetical protein [Amycolatopsis sp. MtRt-6]|uniref:hypothetical protein n=1 Tax=Amycolatopsis sp. MtRt-6 TaxID=2792782 RepID=UPI001A908EA8|nr:hypothetical protein [Amycolatopsis sp. MtRt-6]